jgi:hypothetical protein
LAHRESYTDVLNLLGKTKHITAKNSKTFGEKIAPYIGAGSSVIRPPSPSDDSDSDGELDDDDDKEEEEEEEEEKEEEEAEEAEESDSDETDVEGQTFWPLICKVVIKCGAKALSTGAILVDLPGNYGFPLVYFGGEKADEHLSFRCGGFERRKKQYREGIHEEGKFLLDLG